MKKKKKQIKTMGNLPPKLSHPFVPVMHQQYREGNFQPVTKNPTWVSK